MLYLSRQSPKANVTNGFSCKVAKKANGQCVAVGLWYHPKPLKPQRGKREHEPIELPGYPQIPMANGSTMRLLLPVIRPGVARWKAPSKKDKTLKPIAISDVVDPIPDLTGVTFYGTFYGIFYRTSSNLWRNHGRRTRL